MSAPARRFIAPFLLAAFAHSAFGQVPGRDVVSTARDLYTSARYDEALAVLNDMRPADGAAANVDRKSIEQYPLALPPRTRTRQRSGERDRGGRHGRSDVPAG